MPTTCTTASHTVPCRGNPSTSTRPRSGQILGLATWQPDAIINVFPTIRANSDGNYDGKHLRQPCPCYRTTDCYCCCSCSRTWLPNKSRSWSVRACAPAYACEALLFLDGQRHWVVQRADRVKTTAARIEQPECKTLICAGPTRVSMLQVSTTEANAVPARLVYACPVRSMWLSARPCKECQCKPTPSNHGMLYRPVVASG